MPFDAPISAEIWNAKYRFRSGGDLGDETVEATWARVAAAIAEAEPARMRRHWRSEFETALSDFKFLPAGRIIAGAGTGRAVTLFNCFVMGTIPDNLDGIFEHLREAALTMQQGGGVGMDFSTIRPAGAPVRGVGAQASGPLSFMDAWDAMCRTVMSAGQRRGAMMGCLRIDHPDIEQFIDAKRDPARLRNFNVSVLVTDAFMAALAADQDWPLQFGGQVQRTVRARDLWARVMRATYDAAEPGVIFIDRVNAENNLAYCESIAATNPCGEQPLPPYGACLLGSINLSRLVKRPFEVDAEIDSQELERLTSTAVRFLDNVIDVSRFPLPQQDEEAKAKRRIGVGFTGMGNTLAMLCLRYDAPDGREMAARIAAMSTSAGVLVVSCIRMRSGWNSISASLVPVAGHASRAATASSRCAPCPLRTTFSSSNRSTTGISARRAPATAGRSTRASRSPLKSSAPGGYGSTAAGPAVDDDSVMR